MVSEKLRKLVGKAEQPIDTPKSDRLPLDQITDRPSGDTRPLNQSHVQALAESIAAVGLIQPIAVDNQGQLLAGGHRRAAIAYLQSNNPTAFAQWFDAGVPVHRFDFDASVNEGRALAIEASENEKRRDYTAAEVRELADRLVAVGYTNKRGGVKKGEKAIGPTLEIITGKSRRTIERYLAQPAQPELNPTGVGFKPELNPTPVGFKKQSQVTVRSLTKLIEMKDCPDDVRKVAAKLAKLLGN
jgi:ParB family transcriptional regulator, chromosome partitioning protein